MASRLVAFLLVAVTAGAVHGVVPEAAPEGEGGGESPVLLGMGTGAMVTAGYFFQDTMFYSRGRGGWHVTAGRVWPIPWGLGIWSGAGAYRSAGTMETYGDDASRYETRFAADVAYVDVGIVTRYLPIPVCLALYSHSTEIRNRGLAGPAAGRFFRGGDSGLGWGLNVHILIEYFVSGRRKPPRGLGVVVGYVGFMDWSARDIPTRDAAGGTVTLREWKPLKGESLRLGLEYEF